MIVVTKQPWLCLTLRFPVLAGLKLPEDEIVEIRCKQQDRTVAERKDIDFDGEYVYLFRFFFSFACKKKTSPFLTRKT